MDIRMDPPLLAEVPNQLQTTWKKEKVNHLSLSLSSFVIFYVLYDCCCCYMGDYVEVVVLPPLSCFCPTFLCLFLIYDLVAVRVDPFSVVTVDPCKYSVPPQSKEEFSGNFLYFTYIFLYFTCIFPLPNSYFCLQ